MDRPEEREMILRVWCVKGEGGLSSQDGVATFSFWGAGGGVGYQGTGRTNLNLNLKLDLDLNLNLDLDLNLNLNLDLDLDLDLKLNLDLEPHWSPVKGNNKHLLFLPRELLENHLEGCFLYSKMPCRCGVTLFCW
jgi:hypothetical protein